MSEDGIMATRSLDGGYVVSDKSAGKRFADGYKDSIGRKEKLPDASELLDNGRRCLEQGLLGK